MMLLPLYALQPDDRLCNLGGVEAGVFIVALGDI